MGGFRKQARGFSEVGCRAVGLHSLWEVFFGWWQHGEDPGSSWAWSLGPGLPDQVTDLQPSQLLRAPCGLLVLEFRSRLGHPASQT